MAGSYLPYARISTGNVQTTLDATAKNPVGGLWAPPVPYPTTATFSATAGVSTPGYGAPPIFKYVYFYDAAALTGTAQIAPAPVYYIDESFTTVTPNAADAYFTTGGAAVAGYWMPNTTALGTSNTAAQWYAQFIQSYGWIQIAGFLPGALEATTVGSNAQGNYIEGLATGSWASTTNVALQTSGRILGIQWSVAAGGVYDVLVGGYQSFWGS